MKQSEIDRLVEIVREDVPNTHSEINALKKKLDNLRGEQRAIEKQMILQVSKDRPIVMYESSKGVICEVRDREKSVTLIDKQEVANG